MRSGFLLPAVLLLSATAGGVRGATPAEAVTVEFFEKKVRPILVGRCHACHSADTKPAGGLRVDDRQGLLEGGNTGPAIVPGDTSKSLLLKRITQENAKRRMPLESEGLGKEEIEILTRWIDGGAPWPATKIPTSLGKPKAWYDQVKHDHWAWQPLGTPAVPKPRDASWSRDDIDRFILSKLESENLGPVSDADKLTLIRRVTFDLTGLPPTPAAIKEFLADESPEALPKLVDGLLASPSFGERWGRHWLDAARYGESTGPSRNIPYPHAWKYRDYVIDAVNADVPYDRFVTEQIAGDLLPASPGEAKERLLTATGFLALGVKDVNQRFKIRFVMDNVDEQIDVVSRSILGLTVSCARCHDHKFDPIPTSDYYALAGIFTSTDNRAGVRNKMGGGGLDYYDPSMLVVLSKAVAAAPTEQVEKLKSEVEAAKKAWDAIRGTPEGLAKGPDGFPKQRPYRLKLEKLQGELLALTDPAAKGHAVHGVSDSKTIGDTQIRIRGEAERLGPTVPRGYLSLLEVPGAAPVNRSQSGRLELAKWLVDPKNPLTPRVAVNRIWGYLFGQALVTTVDNFGTTGDAPSHPELLDHLAGRFIRDGWSVKRLVRAIVLSRTYQLGSESPSANLKQDPANRLVWRHSPRRLEAEEIRDAILAASGSLQSGKPAEAPVKVLKMVEMRDNGPEAKTIHERADTSGYRAIYLPLLRGVTPKTLEAFDPVDQTLVSGRREVTSVPSQSLYMLNSSFTRKQALVLADRLLAGKDSDADRVRLAYERILGRTPTRDESDRAVRFLNDVEQNYAEAWGTAPPAPKVETASATPKKAATAPANPDEVDQTDEGVVEEAVRPSSARAGAWLALSQALFASAEFRYLR